MNSGWYYMTAGGWLKRNKRVGPITDAELLSLIDDGKIQPHTLIQSDKTKGKWVPMNLVAPAMERYKANESKAKSSK